MLINYSYFKLVLEKIGKVNYNISLDIIGIKKKRFIEVLVREIVIIIKFIIRFFIILLI